MQIFGLLQQRSARTTRDTWLWHNILLQNALYAFWTIPSSKHLPCVSGWSTPRHLPSSAEEILVWRHAAAHHVFCGFERVQESGQLGGTAETTFQCFRAYKNIKNPELCTPCRPGGICVLRNNLWGIIRNLNGVSKGPLKLQPGNSKEANCNMAALVSKVQAQLPGLQTIWWGTTMSHHRRAPQRIREISP